VRSLGRSMKSNKGIEGGFFICERSEFLKMLGFPQVLMKQKLGFDFVEVDLLDGG